MKKTLLVIIILIFVASFINIYAAVFPDIKKDPYLEEAVGVLSSYKVVQGLSLIHISLCGNVTGILVPIRLNSR